MDFKFLPAGGQFHLRSSDEALTPDGGWVAWDHFLQHGGVLAELAENYPKPPGQPSLALVRISGGVVRPYPGSR